MNFSFKIISFLVIVIVIVIVLLVPIYNADAQTTNTPCSRVGDDALSNCITDKLIGAGGFFPDPTTNDLPQFIGSIIKFALTLMAIIFALLILYAGFQWMTAGGNPEQVKKAAQTIRNSVIGLIIIILAYAITITIFDIILQASGFTTTTPPPPGP